MYLEKSGKKLYERETLTRSMEVEDNNNAIIQDHEQ